MIRYWPEQYLLQLLMSSKTGIASSCLIAATNRHWVIIAVILCRDVFMSQISILGLLANPGYGVRWENGQDSPDRFD